MANKLYEENHIQAIANAIRKKNGSTDAYTVAEMSEALNSVNVRVYKGTLTETTLGNETYTTLLKDDFLKEIRNNENLFLRVEFDIEPTRYTVVKTWATNTIGRIPFATGTNYQCIHRWDANASISINYNQYTLHDSSSLQTGVGHVFITENGELRIYSNSNNYGIRPSNFTVIVEW